MANDVKKGAAKSANEGSKRRVVHRTVPFSPALKKGTRLRSILILMMDDNVSISELGRRVGITRQSMSARFALDDCKVSDMEKMAEALGCEFVWSFKKKDQ